MSPVNASPDPLVGKTLDGRFKILERLGAGGMGTVYKAIQAPLDRLVALKVLNANYDSKKDPGFQRRFFLEASVTSKLKHPNTITVIDYGKTDDNIYYIAMEFVAGVTLAQIVISDGPMSWARCLNIVQQICRSLREAHRAGIIHRDLKPANVMVCNEETESDLVKVLDFGLVKSFLPDGPHASQAAELTQAGVFLGSPQYMAPEQARNLADPRSDIYSLGVVMFQVLTGRPPFTGEQSIDVILKHIKEAPPTFRAVRPDLQVPQEVEALVMRCLQKDPAKRFQTMDEMLEGIRRVVGGLSGPGMAPPSYATPPPMQLSKPPSELGASPTVSLRPPSGQHLGPPPRPGSGQREARRPGSGLRAAMPEPPPLFSSSSNVERSSRSRGPRPTAKGRPVLFFVVSALLGLGVVWILAREPGALSKSDKPATDAGPAQAGGVKFRIKSEPPGARVMLEGKDLGPTPLEFSRQPGRDGIATAKLVFSKEGYENLTFTAAGSGEVVVSQSLRKREPPIPK